MPDSPSPSRFAAIFPVLLVVIGASGLVRHEWRRLAAGGETSARGTFWKGLDEEGATLRVRRGDFFRLDDGELIEFEDAGEGGYRAVEFAGELHDLASFFDLEIVTDGSTYVLRVATSSSFGVLLGKRDDRGRFQPLSRSTPNLALFEKFDLRLECSAGELIAKVATQEVGRVVLDGTPLEATLHARGGRTVIHGVGCEWGGVSGEPPRVEGDDFQGLAEASRGEDLVRFVGRLLLVVLFLTLLLRSLCQLPPSFGLLLKGVTVWLTPLLAWSSLLWLTPVSVGLTSTLVALLIGFLPAIFVMRNPIRGVRTELEASVEEGFFPVANGGRFGIVCATLCMGITAYAAGVFEVARNARYVADEREAVAAGGEREEFELASPMELRADNALTIDASYRDFELSGRVRLAGKAIVQLRLRAPEIEKAEGLSLFLSSDDRFATRLTEETRSDLVDLDRVERPLGEVIDFAVRVRGREIVVDVGGETLRATSRLFPRGGIVLLAESGRATLNTLRVVPVDEHEAVPTSLPDRLRGIAIGAGIPILYALAAAFLLRRRFIAMFWPASVGGLLLAALFAELPPVGEFDLLRLVSWSAAIALCYLMIPLALASSMSGVRYFVLTGLVIGGLVPLFQHLRERPWPRGEYYLSRITPLDWHGARLEREFAHFVHPMHRRFATYLARHQFRGRDVALEKSPGTIRIAALGTSSTFGYAAREPYPHRLETLLRKDGFDVEVMVAAWPGATGTRQIDFLKNVVLDFKPDILTVSLFYNDSYVLSQIDEPTYLREVSAAGYHRGFLEDARDRLRGAMAERTYREILGRGGDVEKEVVKWVDRDPAEAFEEILREFVEVAEENDVDLLFIKEPTAGIRPWRESFYEVMDRVGQEANRLVVHPSPVMDANGGRRLYVDIVHPTDEGHQVMAEAILPYLRRLVRGRRERN